MRRHGKEFDCSTVSSDNYGPLIPNHHIVMKSSDPRYKGNKELVRDLMSLAFLNEVGASPFCPDRFACYSREGGQGC